MQCKVQQKEFAAELDLAMGATASALSIPILTTVQLTASGGADGHIEIAATDLNLSYRSQIPAEVVKRGAVCLPGKLLYNYIDLLDDGTVSLSLQRSGNRLDVAQGERSSSISTLKADAFPQLPHISGFSEQLDAQPLATLLHRVSFCVPEENAEGDGPSRAPKCALLQIRGGSMCLVATDGWRLAVATAPTDAGDSCDYLLARDTLNELQELCALKVEDRVDIGDDESSIFIRRGGRLITQRKLHAQFPNYNAVVPRRALSAFTVESTRLASALRGVVPFSNSGLVSAFLGDNRLKLHAICDAGDATDEIEIDWKEKPLAIGIRAKQIMDFLRVSTGEIYANFTAADSAMLFEPANAPEGFGYQYVVMPMRPEVMWPNNPRVDPPAVPVPQAQPEAVHA
jgi:DNA polymerase III subunit beta